MTPPLLPVHLNDTKSHSARPASTKRGFLSGAITALSEPLYFRPDFISCFTGLNQALQKYDQSQLDVP